MLTFNYLCLREDVCVEGTIPDQILRSLRISPAIPDLLFIELPRITLIVLFVVAKFLKKGVEIVSSYVPLKCRMPDRVSCDDTEHATWTQPWLIKEVWVSKVTVWGLVELRSKAWHYNPKSLLNYIFMNSFPPYWSNIVNILPSFELPLMLNHASIVIWVIFWFKAISSLTKEFIELNWLTVDPSSQAMPSNRVSEEVMRPRLKDV